MERIAVLLPRFAARVQWPAWRGGHCALISI
jgi:hypothetical protein